MRQCYNCKKEKDFMAFIGTSEICRLCAHDLKDDINYKCEPVKKKNCLKCGKKFTATTVNSICRKCKIRKYLPTDLCLNIEILKQ